MTSSCGHSEARTQNEEFVKRRYASILARWGEASWSPAQFCLLSCFVWEIDSVFKLGGAEGGMVGTWWALLFWRCLRLFRFAIDLRSAERTDVDPAANGPFNRGGRILAGPASPCRSPRFGPGMSTSPTSPREPWSISAEIGQILFEISQNFRIFYKTC